MKPSAQPVRLEWANNRLEALAPQDPDLPGIRKYFSQFEHDLLERGVLQEVGEQHDYLRTWRLHAEDIWQQIAIVVFPYVHDAWRPLIFDCFRREGDRWRHWCLNEAAELWGRTEGRVDIAPLWSGLDTLTSARIPFMGEHSIGGFPVLVRPYLPWPTIEERPIAGANRVKVRKTLEKLAAMHWDDVPDSAVISDGERALPLWWSLADRTVPGVVLDVLKSSDAVKE